MRSIWYPLSGESPARTVAVGVVSSSLGLLILPALVVTGYYGRVLSRSSRGEDAPPFGNLGGLLVDGFRTWLAVGAYVAAGVGLFLGFSVAALALGAAGTGLGTGVGLLALLTLGLSVLGIFAFPAWYFVPAALTRVAREESVGAAFDLRAIGRVVFDRRYFAAWFAGCALLAVGTAGYAALRFVNLGVPLVGHLIGAAINFYCQTAAFYCFGRGYAAATDEEVTDETVADEEMTGGAVTDEEVTVEAVTDEKVTGEAVADEAMTDEVVAEEDAERERSPGRSDEWGAEAQRWRKNRRDGDE